MKMFRPLIGLSLAILFLFTCVPTVSAASDSKKKDKKEESSGKKKDRKKDKSKKDDSGDDKKSEEKAGNSIDKNNPYYFQLKKLERLQEDLAGTSSPNKKKRLNLRIKKIQTDIKNDHDRTIARLKKKIHNLEIKLKMENHKTFREKIEKQIADTQELIEKYDAWAGVQKKDAKDGKAPAAAKGAPAAKGGRKAPAGKGGDDAPASADDLGLDM